MLHSVSSYEQLALESEPVLTRKNNSCEGAPPEWIILYSAWGHWILVAPGIMPTSSSHLRHYLNSHREHIRHDGFDVALWEILHDRRWQGFHEARVAEFKETYSDNIWDYGKGLPLGTYNYFMPRWEWGYAYGLFYGPRHWDDLKFAYGGIDFVHIDSEVVLHKEVQYQQVLRYRYVAQLKYELEDDARAGSQPSLFSRRGQ